MSSGRTIRQNDPGTVLVTNIFVLWNHCNNSSRDQVLVVHNCTLLRTTGTAEFLTLVIGSKSSSKKVLFLLQNMR